MKLWNRLVLGSLVLALALGVCVSPAAAASKKKKSEPAKSEEHHAVRHSEKRYISGTNVDGRSGLFYGDTAEVAPKDGIEGSLHATYSSPASGYSNFNIPAGGHFGIAKDLELSAGLQLDMLTTPNTQQTILGRTYGSAGGTATNLEIVAGAKYKIAGPNSESPDFGLGGQIYIPTQTGGQVVVLPQGTVSYVLNNGMLLNGELGIGISTVTYVLVDAGVAYPVSPTVSLIGEIGANQVGYLGSVFAAGARFDLSGTKLQAFLGVPLNGGSVMLGAGIILASY